MPAPKPSHETLPPNHVSLAPAPARLEEVVEQLAAALQDLLAQDGGSLDGRDWEHSRADARCALKRFGEWRRTRDETPN